MSGNTKTLYDMLKKFWRLSVERHYKFYNQDNKSWLSTSLDNLVKYAKMPKEDVLAELETLKADDRIDYYTREYDNREFISFSNNW